MSPLDPKQAEIIVAAVVGGVTAINVILLIVWGVRKVFLRKPTFARTWSLLDSWIGAQLVLIVLGWMMSMFLIGMALLAEAAPGLHLPTDWTDVREIFKDLRLALPLLIIQGVALFSVPALFIVFKYRKRLRDIGLPPLPRAQDWWAGILLSLVLMVVNLGMEVGLTALAKEFRHVPWVAAGLRSDSLQPINELLQALSQYGTGMLLLGVIAIGVSAGLGEEMLFRGFFFNALKRRFGLVAGLVLSGLLFSALHMYFIGFLPVVFMGIVFAWIYHVSGSLWIPIILHATNNSVLVLIAYFFPEAVK